MRVGFNDPPLVRIVRDRQQLAIPSRQRIDTRLSVVLLFVLLGRQFRPTSWVKTPSFQQRRLLNLFSTERSRAFQAPLSRDPVVAIALALPRRRARPEPLFFAPTPPPCPRPVRLLSRHRAIVPYTLCDIAS